MNGSRAATYREGVEMGYRWYDAHNAKPLFPFGFGLSYTTFSISSLKVNPRSSDGTKPIRVQFRVGNSGKRFGAEVPQVYLRLSSSPDELAKRLVGFQKVWLKPDEKKNVELTIDPAASNHPLSTWDSRTQRWTMLSGEYKIYVGNSSTNMILADSIMVRTPDQRR